MVSAKIISDRDTQRSKGFAFVEMANDTEAHQAIALYNGYMLNERALLVNEARPSEARSNRGNFGRGAAAGGRLKFREIKHKARGGRKPNRF